MEMVSSRGSETRWCCEHCSTRLRSGSSSRHTRRPEARPYQTESGLAGDPATMAVWIWKRRKSSWKEASSWTRQARHFEEAEEDSSDEPKPGLWMAELRQMRHS